jgi:hypothetical protein
VVRRNSAAAGRPGGVAHPRALDLPLLSRSSFFINYDFQIPGHAFVGLKNSRWWFDLSRGGRCSRDPVERHVGIEFLLGSPWRSS